MKITASIIKKLLSIPLALLLISSFNSCVRTVDVPPETTAQIKETTVPVTTEPPPPEPVDNSINIRMVGDILLHEPVVESGLSAEGTYNFDHLFANLKGYIEEADIALVNQEIILGGTSLGLSGYPAFNGPFEVGDALVGAGFDIILHASNHAIDRGATGMVNCCNFWRNNHPEITFIGISDSSEKNNLCYKELNGVKFAFLNYTYGTNGIRVPAEYPNAVTYLDETTIRNDVAMAKENSDFVVVCPHWGTEYTHSADNNQKYWSNLFLECGVDLVIGTHPHVIQPCEVLEKDGHKMLVYYSLGNFVNSTAERGAGKGARMVGAMADITVEKNENGNVEIIDYGIIPMATSLSDGNGGITTYHLNDYTVEMAQKTSVWISDSTYTIEYCQELINQVFQNIPQK